MTVAGRLNGTVARLAEHPWFVLAGIVASIGGLGIGLFGSPLTTSPRSSGPSATTSSAPSPVVTKPSAAQFTAEGNCLTVALMPVPCTSTHRYEVIGARSSRCDADELARYLGGHPAHEVLLVAPRTMSLRNGAACVTSDPAGDSNAPAAGVLARPGSGRWRRCLNERVNADAVACSVPHTGEFVGTGDNHAPDAAACRAAAEAYMELALDRVSDRLAVAVVPTRDVADPGPRCLVRVLGDGTLLTDTLRGIGPNALPIEAE